MPSPEATSSTRPRRRLRTPSTGSNWTTNVRSVGPFLAPSFTVAVATSLLRVCRAGGRVVIVDLAAHEREELRNRHAHVRLGFGDEQMLEWLTEAGFTPSPPAVIPGKGLTTKIWIASRDEKAIPSAASRQLKGAS